MNKSENMSPSKWNKDSKMKDTKGNSFTKNSVLERTSTSITLKKMNVKIEMESDDGAESEDEPLTDYVFKEEMATDPEEQQQAINNSNCSDIKTNLKSLGQNQQKDNNYGSGVNSETKMVYEVKLEPVDELYAGHDIKSDMVLGPAGLQAGTNATEDENEIQSNSKTSELNEDSNHEVPRVKLENEMVYEVELEPTAGSCVGDDGMIPGPANTLDEENDVSLLKKPRSGTRSENKNHGNRQGSKKGNNTEEGVALKSAKEITKKKTAQSYRLRIKAIKAPEYNINNNQIMSKNTKFSKHLKVKAECNGKDDIEQDIYFNCEQCTYHTATQDSLQRHMKLHDQSRPFECDVCGYRYKKKAKLHVHLNNVHSCDKIYNCGSCDYSTNDGTHLVIHMRSHSGIKPFSCSECEYKCTRKYDLKEHLKIHTDKKRFSCSLCKFKSIRKGNLTAHLRTHTGEKPISCLMCSYRSARKYDMTKHVRIHHTGEKPFACSLCFYRSARKDQLTSHWNNNHK